MEEILISGYYGFKNSGDDALLLSIINDLKKYKKEVKIVVLSSNPVETSMIYGVKSINRMNFFAIISAMFRSKMLISGGGTLIQDGTSTKSLLYYLLIISLAKKMGLKVMLYSNGVGPLRHKKNEKHTKRVLNKVDLITLRDEVSMNELKRIGVTEPKIYLTADPAFTLKPSSLETGQSILDKASADITKKMMCISVRRWASLGEEFENTVARAADYAAEKYSMFPVFLPMQPKVDYEISKRIAAKMKTQSAVIDRELTIEDTLSVIANMNLCIGMRLHTLIYSASQAVPLVGLVYDPKVSGFMDYMHQRRYVNVENMSYEQLVRLIDDTMENYDMIKDDLYSNMVQLREKAEENAKYAIDLLER